MYVSVSGRVDIQTKLSVHSSFISMEKQGYAQCSEATSMDFFVKVMGVLK